MVMKKLAIFLPTYKRPHELSRVAKNLEENTKNSFTLYFGLEKDDLQGIEAARKTGHKVVINKYEPSYSNTIQTIYEQSKEPFFIHANDDFEFHKDWDVIPLSMFTGKVMVVGMKQTEGDTHGSAISMVKREYIEDYSGVLDMPKRVFYPYKHNCVDSEFTATAQLRGMWAKCDVRVITHLHPGFTGKEKDETYLKNEATADEDISLRDRRGREFGLTF